MSCTVATRLKPRDWATLIIFAMLLFGGSLLCGCPLSVTEIGFVQTSQTMWNTGDWLVPRRSGGPWLESAPLAQWLSAVSWGLFGVEGRIWPLRLPATLASIGTIVIVTQIAARWFGRATGMLSGLILATAGAFAGQAWRATDIPLLTLLCTATLAMFAMLEQARGARTFIAQQLWPSWLTGRSWPMLAFFGLLGLTNLAGPLWLGPICVSVPIVGCLIWNWDSQRSGRYLWLWGWLFAIVIAFGWPCRIAQQFPDAWEFWAFDWRVRFVGQEAVAGAAVSKPIWFYGAALPWLLVPWSLIVPAGIWMTRHEALAERYSPQRFLWCWGALWPIVASFAPGKQALWLLPSLPAWSMLSALGLLWLRERMVEWPDWAKRPWLLGTVVVGPLLLWVTFARFALGTDHGTPLWLCLAPVTVVICVWQWGSADFLRVTRAIFVSLATLYLVAFCEFGQRPDTSRQANLLRSPSETAQLDNSLLSPRQTKYPDVGSLANRRIQFSSAPSREAQMRR